MSDTIIWADINQLNDSEKDLIDRTKSVPNDIVFFEHSASDSGLPPMRLFVIGLFLMSSMSLIGMFALNKSYYANSTNYIILTIATLMLVVGFLVYKNGLKKQESTKRLGVFFSKGFMLIIRSKKYSKIDRDSISDFELSQIAGNSSNPENGKFGITVKWDLNKEEYSCPIITIDYESPVFEKLDLWKESGQLPN